MINYILIGVLTVYAAPYVDQPLYCDCDNTLFYNELAPPWIALDVNAFGDFADCGDTITVWANNRRIALLALDAGPLSQYYVIDWPDLPIVGDIPAPYAPFPGLSHVGTLINTTRAKREFARLAGP